MTMTAIRYPVAPTATPLKGRLLDLVTPTDGMTWQDGRDLYETFNCLRFDANAPFCDPITKDLEQNASYVSGVRFSAYGGATCSAIGMDRDARREALRKVFENGESTAIERALMKYLFVEGEPFEDGGDAPWIAPEDITPTGGAVSPKMGIALLEEFAAATYVGQPTIHVPRLVGALLADNGGAVWDGNALRTNLGAGVAAGVGYSFPNTSPTGTPAAAGERWIYATGEVTLQRGEIIARDEMEYSNNLVVNLLERPYLATVDCFTAAIRVTVEE